MSLERSPLDEEKKKHKTIETVEMSKMPMVKPLFLTYSHKNQETKNCPNSIFSNNFCHWNLNKK